MHFRAILIAGLLTLLLSTISVASPIRFCFKLVRRQTVNPVGMPKLVAPHLVAFRRQISPPVPVRSQTFSPPPITRFARPHEEPRIPLVGASWLVPATAQHQPIWRQLSRHHWKAQLYLPQVQSDEGGLYTFAYLIGLPGMMASLQVDGVPVIEEETRENVLNGLILELIRNLHEHALADYAMKLKLRQLNVRGGPLGPWFPDAQMVSIHELLSAISVKSPNDTADIQKIVDGEPSHPGNFHHWHSTVPQHQGRIIFKTEDQLQFTVSAPISFDYGFDDGGTVRILLARFSQPVLPSLEVDVQSPEWKSGRQAEEAMRTIVGTFYSDISGIDSGAYIPETSPDLR
jgi:hypothetical protein